MGNTITIISLPSQESEPLVDRQGGEAQGLAETTITAINKITKSIPADEFSDKLIEIIGKVKSTINRLNSGKEDYEVEEIKIGLAVTGEGNIGIASTGIETSIEVCLRRKK